VRITALTPTCDRPQAFALCEAMMARQTRPPDEWIVADGGMTPARCTMGQTHIIDRRPPGPTNFASNLLNGIAHATGELLVIIEDDDRYRPDHLERMAAKAADGYRLIGSEDIQRYYNVAKRCWRIFNNVGASLCQTAVARPLWSKFRQTIQECQARGSLGIDAHLWRGAGRNEWSFLNEMTVVGIKGLPGRVGLGVGHRPDARWNADPDLAQLREWIGADADSYAEFIAPKAAA
jgi:glycosyltransferase involved in cell wall biosynthesis